MSGGDERRQRIREQMARFYGDPNAKREVAPAQRGTPGVPPELDLDSEFFNVSKYTTELLKRESLKGLVEADTELLRSMRRLDTELQEQVYQNYAKFISATDTIREMRENVTEMDTKLQALSSNVANIDVVSQSITEKLQQHRSRIEDTIAMNRKLRKVRFLVSLPTAMRQLLEREEYRACVKYWIIGDGFLEKHSGIPRIASIHAECRTLARQLYTSIEENMCAYPLDDPEAMDTIRKYVEDLRLLRATSLFRSGDASDGIADEGSSSSASFEAAMLRVLMRSVAENFSSGVAAVHRGIKSTLTFPADLAEMELEALGELLSHTNLREALAQLKSTCALLSVNSERVYSLVNRLEGADVGMRVAQEVQPVLIDTLDSIAKLLGEWAAAVLQQLAFRGGAMLAATVSGAPANGSPESMKMAVQAAVAGLVRQLKHVSVTLRTLGANYLDTTHSKQSRYYGTLVDQAMRGVVAACVSMCERVGQQRPPDADATSANTAAGAQSGPLAFCMTHFVLGSLAAALGDCLPADAATDVFSPEYLAKLVAQLRGAAKAVHHRGIILLGQTEVSLIFPSAFSAKSPQAPEDEEEGGQAAGTGVRVSRCLRELLAEWAAVYRLVSVLHPTQPLATAASAATSGSRKAISVTVSTSAGGSGGVAAGLASYGTHTFASAGGSSTERSSAATGNRGGRPRLTAAYSRSEDAALHSNVARIFMREADVLHTAPNNGHPTATMAGLIIYVLKGLVDAVRLQAAYDSTAFQRVQLNCTYLLRALLAPAKGTAPREWGKRWGATAINTPRIIQEQINEMCTCAYERYDAKVPLTDAALDKAVEEALSRREDPPLSRTIAPATALPSAPWAAAVAMPVPHPPPITSGVPIVIAVPDTMTSADEELLLPMPTPLAPLAATKATAVLPPAAIPAPIPAATPAPVATPMTAVKPTSAARVSPPMNEPTPHVSEERVWSESRVFHDDDEELPM